VNRERAKELLPIYQAFCEGAVIQWLDPDLGKWCDCNDPVVWFDRKWRIKPEPHDIMWAMQQVRYGRSVRRSSWSKFDFRIKRNCLALLVDATSGDCWKSHVDDITADDWEVYRSVDN